jgi:hypothetical protein
MSPATPFNLNERERMLLAETQRPRLAGLDEDALLALHTRVRKERDKQVQLHRRNAAKAVESKGARGKATQAPRRDASKAELFEDALARVSRAVASAAAASAKQLKEERLAAARGERAGAARSAGPDAPSTPKRAPSARSRRPVETKTAASTRAAGKRTQAKRDSR